MRKTRREDAVARDGRQIGFCSRNAVPLFGVEAGTKGCWLAPRASLAPACVQFLAPRWLAGRSLKRLPARAAARGLPKRRAGRPSSSRHRGTVSSHGNLASEWIQWGPAVSHHDIGEFLWC